jgi:hypothetical protein
MRSASKRKRLAAASLFLVAASAGAQDEATQAARVRELLDTMQLKPMLATVTESLAQDLRDRRELSDADRAVLGPAIARSFSEQGLHDGIVREFVAHYDAAALEAALEFYRSPLGKKVKDAERRAQRDRAGMEEYVKTLELYGVSPERKALAQRFDQATQTTADSLRILLAVTRAGIDGARQLMPAEQRSSAEQVEAHLEKLRPELERAVKRSTEFQILYMHRTLPLQELNAYTEFTETPAGLWLYRTLGLALERVLADATTSFVADVAAAAPATG